MIRAGALILGAVPLAACQPALTEAEKAQSRAAFAACMTERGVPVEDGSVAIDIGKPEEGEALDACLQAQGFGT